MPLQQRDWTVAMVHALPDDGNRYEVIDGELYVTPAPSFVHQRALAGLFRLLSDYAHDLRLDLLFAPAAVTFSERREVQPDLLVLPRTREGGLASEFADVGVLLLAAEILSPGSLRTDRHVKRRLYQEERVHEYWIVDPSSRSVERWTPLSEMPEVVTSAMVWQPLHEREGLTVDVARYFREVFDEPDT